jgi:hypothetical protein
LVPIKYMMKKSLIALFIFLSPCLVIAQEENPPTRSIFVELGGAGLPYSFNYDFRFDKTNLESWGMRIGAGGYSMSGGTSFFSLPLQITRLYGKNGHYFEVGGGATFVSFKDRSEPWCVSSTWDPVTGRSVCTQFSNSSESFDFILDIDSSPNLMGTLNFGYRRIPVDGGFTWRINLTPIFNNNGFWPLWLGIGFGYAF